MEEAAFHYYLTRAKDLTYEDNPLGTFGFGRDIVALWNTVAELSERLGYVTPDPKPTPFDEQAARNNLNQIREKIKGLKNGTA